MQSHIIKKGDEAGTHSDFSNGTMNSLPQSQTYTNPVSATLTPQNSNLLASSVSLRLQSGQTTFVSDISSGMLSPNKIRKRKHKNLSMIETHNSFKVLGRDKTNSNRSAGLEVSGG